MGSYRVYLETTIFSFYYEERNRPGYDTLREEARKTFDILKNSGCEIHTSTITAQELSKEPNIEKKRKTALLFGEYDVILIEEDARARQLAKKYLDERVVPATEPLDALHIAIASVFGLDFIVSLNFAHIVRNRTRLMSEKVNLREGYRKIRIYKPSEIKEVLGL
jgi:hypothetical protein